MWLLRSQANSTVKCVYGAAALLLCAALLGACATDPGSGTSAPERASAVGMADVRLADASPRFSTAHLALEAFCGSCTKDGDCSSNVCRTWADEGFGGIGYCTVTCDSDNPCGAGQGLCVDGTCKVQQVRRCKDGDLWRGDACGNDFEKLETCAPDHPCVAFGTVARCPAISGGQCETCEADEHCKDGYTCEAWTEEPDARWCAKACTTDSDCVFGMSCDAASQTCRPEWKDECSAGERSLKDTCGRELGLPPDCSEGNPCPCDGATDPACKACTTDADCYKGYVCEARSDNATVKWCARACRTDSDCPIGQACNAQAGSGRCVPEVGLGCHGGDAARVDACGNLVEVVQDCTDDQACVEGRCRDGGACAACDEDGDCVGGRVCRSSAVNGDVSFCAKTCTVDGDCDAGYSCDTSDPADKHCVPDDSTVCQAKEVWRQDTCDNMLIKTQDCGTVCVDGACTDADGLCALCNPDLGNADCLADHVCAELSGTGGVNACLPLCGGVHPECPAGTACEGDPARCVPGTRTECTDAGLLKTLDTCGNVINEGQSCGDGEKCLDDQCLTCSCSAGDCCSDGCRPDSVGTVCGDCLVCNASAQCVTAQDGNDPGDRCGADACLGGGCTGTVCGNGTKETGETCDDGNNVSGDGCAGDCSAVEPYCGNGTVDTLEDCDDGNEVGGDGCDTDCTWSCVNPANDCAQMDEDCQKPVCTDVFSQGSKVGQRCGVAADAQDAPVATDTCITTTCEDTTPKNAVMADGNECTVSGEGGDHWCIDGACTLNECGDGYKGDGEECDDGQANNDDVANACRSTCVLPACGDGIVDSGESCDDGGDGDATDGCMDNCEFSCTSDAECGNVVGDCETVTCKANDVGQACTAGVDTKDIKDDDNPCTTDLCIDGEPKNQVDPALEGDSCDPGEPGDGWCISGVCTKNTCGDEILGDGEVCDDGNEVDADGCDNDCTYSCVDAEADCAHTVGDCRKEACNAKYVCTQSVDSSDVPDDTNPCTTDACRAGGVPVNDPLDEGSSCPPEGGGDGWCLSNVCTKNKCTDGIKGDAEVCDDGNEVEGDGCDNDCTYSCVTAADDCEHTVGDCHKEICTAQHTCDQQVDGTDIPDDGNHCTNDVCKPGGVPANENLDEGSSCPPTEGGDGWCSRDAVCVKNVCGDGIKGDEEVCDDGNKVDADG